MECSVTVRPFAHFAPRDGAIIRALWRQTVLPLAGRIGAALAQWLAPAFGGDLRLIVDTDQIDALASDRSALWERVAKADFLSVNEKRQMLGFGPLAGGDDLSAIGTRAPDTRKAGFNPGQLRVPASNPGAGQWTSVGNSSSLEFPAPAPSESTVVAQAGFGVLVAEIPRVGGGRDCVYNFGVFSVVVRGPTSFPCRPTAHWSSVTHGRLLNDN